MIDTHCHIHGEAFDDDRDAVLSAAFEQGVTTLLAMGEHADDNERLFGVANGARGKNRARVLPCFGLHPDQTMRCEQGEVSRVIAQLRKHREHVVAVGEVGLDYWVAETDEQRQRQRQHLATFVELAKELELPLSVHSRSAGHHTIALLSEHGAARVCMHAFDGAAKHAVRAHQEHGFFFSIPPSVVRSPQKQKLVKRLPLSALMLETDSPVLAPEAGTRNVPANAALAARAISDIKRCPLEEVQAVTSANAEQLFGL
jgi:TatD DNase family protein